MTIRKGRLHRPCDKCGKLYEKVTQFQKICMPCNEMKHKKEWKRK